MVLPRVLSYEITCETLKIISILEILKIKAADARNALKIKLSYFSQSRSPLKAKTSLPIG